ncbi:MAG: sugar phosphate isomerase/epimerase [Anaerolineae bacterium]|nr:sugar phosphate isomerase/epimerase [Anaerolineae bacterium]
MSTGESGIRLGVIAPLAHGPEQELEKARAMGLPTCQIVNWQPDLFNDEMAERVVAASAAHGVEVTTIWAGYPGPAVWNFIEGPVTIGLVPEQYRVERVAALKRGADFAVQVGVPSITTHVGFIPENPSNPLYPGVVEALRDVVGYCRERGLTFCFETGQETPVVLLRVIEDLGAENLGINLDPANLLMYGKANPVDALDVFGQYVVGVHAKDGEYPTNGRELGVEKPLGEGRVCFPRLIAKLKELGYRGALTIEREISGPKQIEDIRRAIELLSALI